MTTFFRNSSHASPLQQAIEKVTDPSQANEDWTLIMTICDHVTYKEENAKEAMKLIRKRLQINPSGPGLRVISLTLTLLEALTKNCGKIFHLQIAHREFLKELKSLIGPKNNPPLQIQQRVLAMIQNWALAFRQDPDLKQIEYFYQECKQQGLEFPPAESERVLQAAIPTAGTIERPSNYSRSISQPSSSKGQLRSTRSGSDALPNPAGSFLSSQTSAMNQEQLAKLRSELDVVQTNVQVFGEMLVTLQPGDENPQDFELLMELHRTCQQMQSRIVELLGQISIDEITVDLLRFNDSFIHSFKLFENYIKERDRKFKNSPLYNRSENKPTVTPTRVKNDEPALIQFDDEPSAVATNFQTMQISSSVTPKPIASNPRSMNFHSSSTTRSTTYNDDPERDVREVEEWLKVQGDIPDQGDSSQREDGTTAAFNNFLEKRASTIPAEPSNGQFYQNMQPVSNRIDLNDR